MLGVDKKQFEMYALKGNTPPALVVTPNNGVMVKGYLRIGGEYGSYFGMVESPTFIQKIGYKIVGFKWIKTSEMKPEWLPKK